VAHVFEAWIAGDRFELFAEFGDDFLEPFGLKDVGLLNASQRGNDGIEEEQEEEGTILIEMEFSISGLIALTSDVMESGEERHELVEVF